MSGGPLRRRQREPPWPSEWPPASSASSRALAAGPRGTRVRRARVGLPGWPCKTAAGSHSSPVVADPTAFLNDLFWTVLLVLGARSCSTARGRNVGPCLLVSAAPPHSLPSLGAVQAQPPPRPNRAAIGWLRTHRAARLFGISSRTSASAGRQQVRYSCWERSPASPLRVRAGFRDPDGSLLRRSGGAQPGGGSGSLSRVPSAIRERTPALLSVSSGAIGGRAAVAWGLILMTVFPLGLGPR